MGTIFRRLFFVSLTLVLASCGWHLRGFEQYQANGPQKIEEISLYSASQSRLFNATLNRQLEDLAIIINPNADITLHIQQEQTERRPLSYSSTGIPVQYQLIMRVRFGLSNKLNTAPTERTFSARREYDFDATLVVAKKDEELNLLQEMREEIASRIIAQIGK